MEDIYNLERFREKEMVFEIARQELLSGRKRSHWMWFMFPQIDGLAYSDMSKYYSIQSLDEARAFLKDEVLGGHLINLCQILLQNPSSDSYYVFGDPDYLKLKSSMTLFMRASPDIPIFQRVLDKFYQGNVDARTDKILMRLENEKQISNSVTKTDVIQVISDTYLEFPSSGTLEDYILKLKDAIKEM